MERQPGFRSVKKREPVMKGASKLDLHEFPRYDTKLVHDNLAKCSRKIALSNINEDSNSNSRNKGDDDVWVEKLFASKRTGKLVIFFVSKKTGEKVQGEPPSGASRVLYLKESYKEKKFEKPIPVHIHISPKKSKN